MLQQANNFRQCSCRSGDVKEKRCADGSELKDYISNVPTGRTREKVIEFSHNTFVYPRGSI